MTMAATLELPAGAAVEAAPKKAGLMDLMREGFLLIFLLKNGDRPSGLDDFKQRIDTFLQGFDRDARRAGFAVDDVYLAKYAFCAALDEIILTSQLPLRHDWEAYPLQIQYFGDHLAGEVFFDHLEKVRMQGAASLSVLEVFYYCLVLGFEGKYRLEGPEKLNYLIGRVGEEIRQLRGKHSDFAPHWAIPDKITQVIAREMPMWLYFVLLAVVALLSYGVFRWLLGMSVDDLGRQLVNLVQPVAQQAYLIISTP